MQCKTEIKYLPSQLWLPVNVECVSMYVVGGGGGGAGCPRACARARACVYVCACVCARLCVYTCHTPSTAFRHLSSKADAV